MPKKEEIKVLIKGAGEMASGIAHKLFRSGFKICMTEIPMPIEGIMLYFNEITLDCLASAIPVSPWQQKPFLFSTA